MKNVTCNKCGWVAFTVTRQYAEDAVKKFNDFYDSTDDKTRSCYGGKTSITHYEHCFFCGTEYTNFRPFKDGDCPDGCTLQPIIQD